MQWQANGYRKSLDKICGEEAQAWSECKNQIELDITFNQQK